MKKYRKQSRKISGQALVGGTAMLSVSVIFVVGLIALLLNFFFACNYSIKAQVVANEAAKIVDAHKYWLGLPRVDYNAEATATAALSTANELCQQLGLPPIQSGDFVVDSAASTITLTIRGCAIPCTSVIFPSMIPVTALGVCPQSVVTPYGIMQIGVPVPNTASQYQIVTLPAYGFCQGTKTIGGGYTNVIGFAGGDKSGVGESNALSLSTYNWFAGLPLQDESFYQALQKGRNASK